MNLQSTTRSAAARRYALDGMRVIDMTSHSAVYATKLLADLGADVIRVEPIQGDEMRARDPVDPASGRSLFYEYMNVNKRAVTLDLDKSAGCELFRDLVAKADAVVESFPPGRLDALGIGPEALTRKFPALVWASVTPFGSAGPYAGWQADDLVSQAMGGLMFLSGAPERSPLRLFGEQTSYIAGLHAATATLIAYYHAQLSGQGQRADVSVHECIAHTLENAIQFFTAEGVVRQRSALTSEAGVGLFPCADGQVYLYASAWMLLNSWHRMVDWLAEESIAGAEALRDSRWLEMSWRRTPEAQKTFRDMMVQLTRKRSRDDFCNEAQRRNILTAPLNLLPDLFKNPQLTFFDWFRAAPWDESRTAVFPGAPYRFSGLDVGPGRAAPRAGQHNRDVYCGMLSLSADAFDRLAREGTI